MAKLAESLFVNGRTILIDGDELPWGISDEDLKVEYNPDIGMSLVYLPVLIDGPVRIEPRR